MSSFTSVGSVMTLFQVSWMDQNSRSAQKGHSFTLKDLSHLEANSMQLLGLILQMVPAS